MNNQRRNLPQVPKDEFEEQVVKIKVKGENKDNLASALKKIVEDNDKIGFNKISFTDEEKKVLKDISDKL